MMSVLADSFYHLCKGVFFRTQVSILSRQCLNRHLPDQPTLMAEVAAWEHRRNTQQATVEWRFTSADARIKLKKLYPTFELIK
jgi:hypothetical protein